MLNLLTVLSMPKGDNLQQTALYSRIGTSLTCGHGNKKGRRLLSGLKLCRAKL